MNIWVAQIWGALYSFLEGKSALFYSSISKITPVVISQRHDKTLQKPLVGTGVYIYFPSTLWF